MKDTIASNVEGMPRLQDGTLVGPHSRVSAEINPVYAPLPLAGLLMAVITVGTQGLRVPIQGEMVNNDPLSAISNLS
ncbi:hypothetical protein PX699_24685 [Sphingobium sp. H39-3-25]|uniref:hypothetical protein n=1 Tax=Sphingomonadales TaxID=204457 RepID=UPI00057E8D0E|nr:hypothetical protein [Sphingopyxis fribergensis]MDF0545563.1 hypothetical protein [Sphingobium arseniciresistens]